MKTVFLENGVFSGVAPANQTKKSQFMNFSQGRSGTKVQCESCLFSQGKTPEFTKKGKIHELCVLALFLVWFAGATPDFCPLPITGGFDEKWRKRRFTLPTKIRGCAPQTPETDKNDENGRCPSDKTTVC